MKRMKMRGLGFTVGQLPTGNKNCITDVEGVLVGQVTLNYPITNENMSGLVRV